MPTFSLKGVCDEIFDRYFFHDLNPSGSLINRLKYFRILEFHRDIKIFKKLCSVHPTAVSRKQNTVCPKTLPRASHRRDRLCSVHPSLKSSFATCIIPRILAPLCASYQWVSNFVHTNSLFDPKFYKFFFSVMPQDITLKIIL